MALVSLSALLTEQDSCAYLKGIVMPLPTRRASELLDPLPLRWSKTLTEGDHGSDPTSDCNRAMLRDSAKISYGARPLPKRSAGSLPAKAGGSPLESSPAVDRR